MSPIDRNPSEIKEQLRAALAERYEIREEAGTGGMAIVFSAYDRKLERVVAIKVLRPELLGSQSADRFLNEIRIIARLQHPNILPLLEADSAAGFIYYVMPFVDGPTLRGRMLRDGAMPIASAVRTLIEVADAVAAAHAMGVVHRDIKPENVLLSGRHALVADFGVSRAFGNATGHHRMTSVGLAIGTPTYMAPEQASGEDSVDHRVDIYALGVLGFELLTGRPPFDGASASKVLSAHLTQAPEDPAALRPEIPRGLSDLILRCLAKSPADRPASADALVQALEPFASPSGDSFPAMAAAAGARSPATRRGVRAWQLVLAAALVTGLGIALAGGGSGPSRVELGATTPITIEPGLELDPAISPDGATLAYVAALPGVRRTQLFVRSMRGGTAVAISNDESCSVRTPKWLPSGAGIVAECGGRLLQYPALGGTPTVLVPESAQRHDISPDGAQLAFTRAGTIVVHEISSGRQRVLVEDLNEPHSLAWSPDGRRIAFVQENSSFLYSASEMGNLAPSFITIVDVDDASAFDLTSREFFHESPVWLRSGDALIFVSNEGGGRDVFMQPLNGRGRPKGNRIRVTNGLGVGSISLSNDETRLAYTVFSNSANVWAVPISSRGIATEVGARPVTVGNQHVEALSLSPDGQWMAFDSDRAGNADIWRMPVAGGEPLQLTKDPSDDFAPTWSADGKTVVFHTWRHGSRDVYAVGAEGGAERPVVVAPGHQMYPAFGWEPSQIVFRNTFGALSLNAVRWTGDSAATEQTKLVPDFTGDAGASWSLDRSKMAYFADDAIVVVDREGRELQRFPESRTGARRLQWSRDGETIFVKQSVGVDGVSEIRGIALRDGSRRVFARFANPERLSQRNDFDADATHFYVTFDDRRSDISVLQLSIQR